MLTGQQFVFGGIRTEREGGLVEKWLVWHSDPFFYDPPAPGANRFSAILSFKACRSRRIALSQPLMEKKPVVLIIRDGWGVNPGGKETAITDGNATLLAKTPFHQQLFKSYPKGFLSASGLDVGLPPGQMGNSEVGHLNLGAGRIVYQDLTRINKSIDEGTLATNPVFVEALAKAKNSRLHFIGLVSDGGVHSQQDQLIAMVKLAHQAGVRDCFIHAITDGRDTSPTGGAAFVAKVEDEAARCGAHIATVIGRYFAMDRDQRWDRVNSLGTRSS
jgi:2,3-bisphosphoglycerate-independent phosphoglycerate mutase